MKIRKPIPPPLPLATVKDPKSDFTAEGSPPPGKVANAEPVGSPPRSDAAIPPRTRTRTP
jgi:hypothetical protein